MTDMEGKAVTSAAERKRLRKLEKKTLKMRKLMQSMAEGLSLKIRSVPYEEGYNEITLYWEDPRGTSFDDKVILCTETYKV
jgi:hypothetical protein